MEGEQPFLTASRPCRAATEPLGRAARVLSVGLEAPVWGPGLRPWPTPAPPLAPADGLSDHSAKADCEDAGGVNTVAAASTDTSFGR